MAKGVDFNYPGSAKNSSSALLIADAVFTGGADAISITENSQAVTVSAYSDEGSAAGGLLLRWSMDGTNWDRTEAHTVIADEPFTVTRNLHCRYFSLTYTNGSTGQSAFRLQTVYRDSATSDGTSSGADFYPSLFTAQLKNAGSGSIAVDGSDPAITFTLAGANPALLVYRLLFTWSDTGLWRSEYFAGFGAALAVGCDLEYTRAGTTIDLFGGISVTNNFELASLAYDNEIVSIGAGDTFLKARYTLAKFGGPISLRTGDTLTFRVNDDLTGLVDGYVIAEGVTQ